MRVEESVQCDSIVFSCKLTCDVELDLLRAVLSVFLLFYIITVQWRFSAFFYLFLDRVPFHIFAVFYSCFPALVFFFLSTLFIYFFMYVSFLVLFFFFLYSLFFFLYLFIIAEL